MKVKLVTVREAADFLRISYRTAQRYLAEGRIPYTKPAGRVARLDELRQYDE